MACHTTTPCSNKRICPFDEVDKTLSGAANMKPKCISSSTKLHWVQDTVPEDMGQECSKATIILKKYLLANSAETGKESAFVSWLVLCGILSDLLCGTIRYCMPPFH